MPLLTESIWYIYDIGNSYQLIDSLDVLCQGTDIVVVATYEPGDAAYLKLQNSEIKERPPKLPYDDFGLRVNRREYPRGNAFHLRFSKETHALLKELVQIERGEHSTIPEEKVFDDIAIYRDGTPLVPLLDYHLSFNLDHFFVSGLYDEETILRFTDKMDCSIRLVKWQWLVDQFQSGNRDLL